MFFKRDDDSAGNKYPWLDLGTVDVISPQMNPTKAQLYDADGGRQRLVDERITKIDEVYMVKTQNLNPTNIAMAFLADPPTGGTQSAAEFSVAHYVFAKKLFKVLDSSGNPVYGLSTIAGLYTGTVLTTAVTDAVLADNHFKFTGDMSAVAGLQAGQVFILQRAGLTHIENSRSYTVVSNVYTSFTTIVVAETIPYAETGIAGQATYKNAGTIYKQDTDWKVMNLDRGFGQAIDGGAIAADASITVVYSLAAITGSGRLITPQSLQGLFKGKMLQFWSRNGFSEQTVRYASVSLLPKTITMSVTNYCDIEFDVAVLIDLSASIPAGLLNYFKGAMPTTS
jgi:hypothetical protein